MRIQVSQRTNSLPCTKCGREPRRPGQRWGNQCFAEYNRHQRAMDALAKAAGVVKMKLDPEEQELIMLYRQHPDLVIQFPKPAGRHHAAG